MAAGAAQEPAAALSSDRFRVKISHVRGELRTTEPRPVFLRFDFDKESWVGETSVYSSSVNPVWTFAKQSPKLPSSSKENEDSEKFVARFDYKTEYAHRFHRKYLVVHLAERSPQGDVQWGSGRIPLESLARGCENVALSMIAQDDVTCFGTIRFSASMVNVAEVSVLLSDLKLLDYPARYSYDVKLVYFEFGFLGFQDGYRQCTERRSDSEPRFFTRPALKRDCTLPEMIAPSASEHGPLRVFFSVHRQVAKNRTEEIGLGALPIKMLFAKVNDGWMDVPTKFKVPLHDQKGVLKGKVLLRNIPRFCQLPGEDLVNVNGVITPIDVDFSQRKIVPWLKLPRSLESQLKKPAKESPLDSADSQQSAGTSGIVNGMVNGIASISYDSSSSIGVNRLSRPGHVRRASGPEGAFLEPRSPVDGINFNLLSVAEGSASYPATPQITTSIDSGYLELKSPISGDMRPQVGQSSYGVTFSGPDSTVGLNGLSVSDVTPSVNGVSYGLPSHAGETVTSERRDSTSIGNSESETLTTVRRSKSGKSVGSFGTHEGVPEIGSMLNSMTSEDCIHSSRTSAEDGMAGNSASTDQGEEDEWIAVKDPSNDLYYFASQYTQESLWLPPDWDREEDEFGRQIFVDRSTGRSQTFFPADEARQYRASVYAG